MIEKAIRMRHGEVSNEIYEEMKWACEDNARGKSNKVPQQVCLGEADHPCLEKGRWNNT